MTSQKISLLLAGIRNPDRSSCRRKTPGRCMHEGGPTRKENVGGKCSGTLLDIRKYRVRRGQCIKRDREFRRLFTCGKLRKPERELLHTADCSIAADNSGKERYIIKRKVSDESVSRHRVSQGRLNLFFLFWRALRDSSLR